MSDHSTSALKTRIIIWSCLVALVVPFLAWRFYHIQVKRHDYYLSQAQERYTAKRTTSGKRGEIFDRHGHLLVGNMPCVDVSCTPYNIADDEVREIMIPVLVKYFGETPAYYRSRMQRFRTRTNPETGKTEKRRNQYLLLDRSVELITVEEFKADLKAAFDAHSRKVPHGVMVYRESTRRVYPKGRMFANILGYSNVVNDEEVPQGGLERRLDDEMTAETGVEVIERTRDNVPLLYGNNQILSESRDGNNVYLTIDEPIQAILEEELDAAYAKWNPETIYAVIADPRTGDVLAMAQRPTFDPNDRKTFTPMATRTRIAEDTYEPGSVVKPFSIGKALDWGIVSPDTIVDCEKGRWVYYGKPLTDTHDYGKPTVAGVIQKSSNIGTAKVALLMGEENVYHALKLFGFGTRTNLPLPNESVGYLPRPSRWDKLSITRFPIGYGIRLSPLQLLRAYCALANDGKMPQLRLLDRLENSETGAVKYFPTAPQLQLFENPEAHRQLVEMMISVTQKGGTATRAAIPGFLVAGKTGTSKKFNSARGGYASGQYFASFIGFVPARAPRLVMLVTMDNPRGSIYGGTVAAPVFSKTAARILRYWNVQPTEALEE